MFGFSKSKKKTSSAEEKQHPKKSWLSRLNHGLKRTRERLGSGVANLFLGKKKIDDDLLKQLETYLLAADVGVEATEEVLKNLTQQIKRKTLSDPQLLLDALKQQLLQLLLPCEKPLEINQSPFVILAVGINGAGKTTTIAKLAHFYKSQGKKIILAAGDTFRAAAIEQLQTWGEHNQVPVIAQQSGADSASVVFDALDAAKARQAHLLIADTAGRLHTQSHLMDELEKIKRVLSKNSENAPQETLLVIDAGNGQNALNQALEFHETIGLTGIVITKLDGTAKGGIIFAIAKRLQLPIRFIGVGESMEDLKPFVAKEFIEAIFTD